MDIKYYLYFPFLNFIGPKSDHWLPLLKIGQYFAADAWFKVMQFNPIRTGLFDHI